MDLTSLILLMILINPTISITTGYKKIDNKFKIDVEPVKRDVTYKIVFDDDNKPNNNDNKKSNEIFFQETPNESDDHNHFDEFKVNKGMIMFDDGFTDIESKRKTRKTSRVNSGFDHNGVKKGFRFPFSGNYNDIRNTDKVSDPLTSILNNDDHQCVPRLLCEVTGGRASEGPSGFLKESISRLQPLITILLANNNYGTKSSLLTFGKAMLIGMSETSSCVSAYPLCPSEPEAFIHYLNTYKGGLLRYFNHKN